MTSKSTTPIQSALYARVSSDAQAQEQTIDSLARRYAYQVLVVDELQKLGIEIVFFNRAIGSSPEADLLLQMQGMFAEYERAKVMERNHHHYPTQASTAARP